MDEDNSHVKEIKSHGMDNLSKEELVSKCKNFIVLLKKAKTFKDELAAELEKEKVSKAKLMKSFENAQNHSDEELEALKDVVTNLTDNKINLVTKSESLQRQLQLQLSEVESLKDAENILLDDRNIQQLEIEKLQILVQQQVKLIENVTEEKNMLKHQSTLWNEEKFHLVDKIQALEEQISRTELLKSGIKLLVEESSEKELESVGLSQENKDLRNQVRLMEEEIKAIKIVQDDINLKKKEQHENLKVAKDKLKSLSETQGDKHKEDFIKELNDKLLNAEQYLQSCRHELEQVNAEKLKIEESSEKLLEKDNCGEFNNDKVSSSDKEVDSSGLHLLECNIEQESWEKKLEEFSSLSIRKTEQIEDLLTQIQLLEQELQHLKLVEKRSSELSTEYELLKKETETMIRLINKLLYLEEDIFVVDILKASKVTCIQIENLINSFSGADLEAYCDKFSSEINKLAKEFSFVMNSTEKWDSECLIVGPVISIFTNLAKVIFLINKVFKFSLTSDFFSNIDFVKLQAKNFGKFFANLNNDKHSNLNEISSLHCQIEVKKNTQIELSEEIKELEKNCKYFEESYNEEHKLKLLQEDTLRNLNDINKDMSSKLEMLVQEDLLSKEKFAGSVQEKSSVLDSARADCVHKDKVIREKDCLIFELKENLSKNIEIFINEITHKCNIIKSNYEGKILEIHNLLCSKQEEISSLEKSYFEAQEDMKVTESSFQNVKHEISEIRISFESLVMESFEVKKALEMELDLVKKDKLAIESELLIFSKQLQEKVINESSLLKINNEGNDLKTNILTLESNLDGIKKELKKSFQSNKTLTEECQRFKNLNEEASNEILKLENEIKDILKHKSEAENNIVAINKENLSLIDQCESFAYKVKEFEEYSKVQNEKICGLSLDLDSLRDENKKMSKDAANLEDELQSTIAHKEELSCKIADMESKFLEMDKLYDISIKQYDSCQEKCKSLNESNDILSDKLENVENELDQLSRVCAKNKTKYQVLLKENSRLTDYEIENSIKLQEILKLKDNLEEQLSHSDIKLAKLLEENDMIKLKMSSFETKVEADAYTSFQEEDEQKKQELVKDDDAGQQDKPSSHCSEILADLNNMNEVLRERGEKISRLEDIIREKNRELDLLNSQLEEAKNKVTSREEELNSQQEQLKKIQLVTSTPVKKLSIVEEFEAKITTLEQENEHLRSGVHGATDNDGSSKMSQYSIPCVLDNQSEVMSTSTISKAEDIHRLKELEDTFEERYMKLKSVAIKLKKKLAEQSVEIRLLEEAKKTAIIEKEEFLRKLNGTVSKNIQVLQSEIDKLQDNLDINSKELKIRDKQIFSLAQEISNLKGKLVAIMEEKEKQTTEIKNLEVTLSGQESANISLRNQVSSLETRLKSEEKRRINSEERQKSTDDKLKGISIELEEVRQESKKHSLMDLEMKDYEKIIEELTNQKANKEFCSLELEQLLDNEIMKVKNLNDQIHFLQKQVESEGDRAENLKKMVSDYKVQLEDLRLSNELHLLEKQKNTETMESLNQELENLKIAMAELSVESSKSESSLRKAKEATENQVECLEGKVDNLEKANNLLTDELHSLQNEFAGYKIRAQSVLKKKSTVPEGSLEQVKFDREQLSAELEAAHIKTHQLQSDLAAVKTETRFLLSEKDRLSKQTVKLTEELHKNEVEYLGKLESLQKKLDSKTKEYQRIIASMSTQSEEMQKNVKLQEEAQKENYCQEIKNLQFKLEYAEDKIWQLQNISASGISNGRIGSEIKESCLAVVHHHIRKHGQGVANSEDHSKIDISNMIREDGEGSEWVEPSRHWSPSHSSYSPPTLEQLLNNPFPPQQSFDESASIVSATTDYTMREMIKLESKVESCEKRIIQLTSLLSDSEAENAKLVQLSDMLKEEIRRVSRNESREKHLENNEYIKNVVLKFLLLKTGDEKFRLIPVLKTILQLSPDETKQLAVIAKGDDGSGSGSQAWASYLHLWSGR